MGYYLLAPYAHTYTLHFYTLSAWIKPHAEGTFLKVFFHLRFFNKSRSIWRRGSLFFCFVFCLWKCKKISWGVYIRRRILFCSLLNQTFLYHFQNKSFCFSFWWKKVCWLLTCTSFHFFFNGTFGIT